MTMEPAVGTSKPANMRSSVCGHSYVRAQGDAASDVLDEGAGEEEYDEEADDWQPPED